MIVSVGKEKEKSMKEKLEEEIKSLETILKYYEKTFGTLGCDQGEYRNFYHYLKGRYQSLSKVFQLLGSEY